MHNGTTIDTFFGPHNGFGEHSQEAIDLLAKTIEILNKYEINYFLISGTLLGHVRHANFIPWDDDIDLLVDKSIVSKFDQISEENPEFIFTLFKSCVYKASFVSGVKKLRHLKHEYCWPFIDLFIYGIDETHLSFFGKRWEKVKFLPPATVEFVGIPNVNIPNDSSYFLERNYGPDYMNTYVSSGWCHKREGGNRTRKISAVEYNNYMELKHV